jgi:hypothetical protein
VREVRTFGHVVASQGCSGLGGFVLISDRPLMLVAEPSQMAADALLAPGGGTYFGQGTPFREIMAQYRVRGAPGPADWVWIQWREDTELVEGGCERRFSLFRTKPEPSEIGATNYHCDV